MKPLSLRGLLRPGYLSPLSVDCFALIFLCLFCVLFFHIRPVGFYGDGYDDERYVRAAVNWLQAFPYLGSLHWDLRHPFNLLLAAGFYLFGVNQEVIVTVCYAVDFALLVLNFAAMRLILGRELAILSSILLFSAPLIAAGTVGVEPLELLFSSTSFWALWVAAKTNNRFWMVISGLCLGLAWEIRETAAFLILLYALSWLFFPVVSRKDYALLVAAACVPVALELAFYYAFAHDLLYRIHVDANHIHVSSAHMVGRVSEEKLPFLNLRVMQSWLPYDDFMPGFWLTYPYQALFADPFIGLMPIVALGGVTVWLRSGNPRLNSPLAMLAIGAVLSFVVPTYILVLRPDARYYVFAILAAATFAAVAILHLWRTRHYGAAVMLACAILVADCFGLQLERCNDGAYAAIAYLRSHNGLTFVGRSDLEHFNVGLRDPALLTKLATQPGSNIPVLHFAEFPTSCPGDALWCAQPPESIISRMLHLVGLDRRIPPKLLARLSSGGTVAYSTRK